MSLYSRLTRRLFPIQEDQPRPFYTPQYRLEVRARSAGFDSEALAMRIADPLWMLGRQWQFGEFQAEDTGSPIRVDAFYHKEKAGYYKLGAGQTLFPLNGSPLEAEVEAMPVEIDLKSKVRIGQRFERLINSSIPHGAAELIAGLRLTFPLTATGNMDAGSNRFLQVMAGKVVDGGKLLESIDKKATPWENAGDKRSLILKKSVVPKLIRWYADFFLQPKSPEDSAWRQEHLSHHLEVHHHNQPANSRFFLRAPDYQSGHLDWYSFDTAKVDPDLLKQVPEKLEGLTPVRATFSGMPDKRLFAFEDSRIDLSLMNIETGDLLKTILVHFAMVSGVDWFTIPLSMTAGELCWVDRIEVQDVFGVVTTVANNDKGGLTLSENGLEVWDIFKVRNRNVAKFEPQDHFLALFPSAAMRQESEPLEELLFLRDEYANMVWALERRVSNAMGKAVDGYDLHLELNGPFLSPQVENEKSLPKYRLASTVPANWIPFLPYHLPNDPNNIELKVASMMRNEAATKLEEVQPLTRLLRNDDIHSVREEAIPRAGVRVQVTNQRVRWTDGKTYLWRGRKVLAGRGEGNSGLHFDYLKD